MCYNIGVRLLGTRDAGVAQSVEQLIRNQQVAGSNPATSSKETAFVLMTKAVSFFNFYCVSGVLEAPCLTGQRRIPQGICKIIRTAAAAIANPAAFGTNAMLAGGCRPFSLGLYFGSIGFSAL